MYKTTAQHLARYDFSPDAERGHSIKRRIHPAPVLKQDFASLGRKTVDFPRAVVALRYKKRSMQTMFAALPGPSVRYSLAHPKSWVTALRPLLKLLLELEFAFEDTARGNAAGLFETHAPSGCRADGCQIRHHLKSGDIGFACHHHGVQAYAK